jgi:hypothetical protein
VSLPPKYPHDTIKPWLFPLRRPGHFEILKEIKMITLDEIKSVYPGDWKQNENVITFKDGHASDSTNYKLTISGNDALLESAGYQQFYFNKERLMYGLSEHYELDKYN